MKINSIVEINDINKTDLHMHTCFCDGNNTPEEMVLAAIEKGLECIGFSGHSFVPDDLTCGMNEEAAKEYFKEVLRLKAKYEGQITIYCGIEEDYESGLTDGTYDYVIGSVHYLDTPEGAMAVDDTVDIFKNLVERYYGGDYYSAAERYFEKVSEVVEKTGADIIGHFDLISKFNEKEKLFDEGHPRYEAAWRKAADRLIKTGKVFEINSGAISRGWRSVNYPNPVMISYIRKQGGQLIYSSDSHSRESIGFESN